MVSQADLYEWVIVSGDPGVPDGIVGILTDLFPDCAAVEAPPDVSSPNGDVWIAALDAVSRFDDVPPEVRARINKGVIFRDLLGFTSRDGLDPFPWTPQVCGLRCSTQLIRSSSGLW